MRTRRGAATPTDSPQASTRWRTCCPRYLNKSQLGNLEESSDNASTRLGSQHGAYLWLKVSVGRSQTPAPTRAIVQQRVAQLNCPEFANYDVPNPTTVGP